MNKFKKDDLVIVITGKDKGNTGTIQKVHSNNTVTIEGINNVKKHLKPSQNNKGGIVDINKPIHISNIMHYSKSKKAKSKVSFVIEKNKKVRVLKSTNETI
tara:strand:+ start:252 stop:554 length:303 start_codon:yes stop_codon:yes gene_type:complete